MANRKRRPMPEPTPAQIAEIEQRKAEIQEARTPERWTQKWAGKRSQSRVCSLASLGPSWSR
jgi:hypothetical protein